MSRMRGNSHVRFLEGGTPVRGRPYSTPAAYRVREIAPGVHNRLHYTEHRARWMFSESEDVIKEWDVRRLMAAGKVVPGPLIPGTRLLFRFP